MQQSCSRRARRDPSPRMTTVTIHEKQEINERQPNPRNSPSHNHDSAAPRQHTLICTGAGPIHPVHAQPMSLATKAISRNKVTFSPFSPFSRVSSLCLSLSHTYSLSRSLSLSLSLFLVHKHILEFITNAYERSRCNTLTHMYHAST